MALPKQNRLGSARDFSRVHRRGKRASTQYLAVRALCQSTIPLSGSSFGPENTPIPRQTKNRQAINQSLVLRSGKRLDLAQSSQVTTQSVRPIDVQPTKVVSESADGIPSALSSSFGISISRKVSKRAVVRNRIKRQLKAIIRRNLPNIAPGWQVVIVVRPAAVECGFDDYLRELEGLLKKLKILN